MRGLKKNMQKFYYATYDSEIKVYKTDADGKIVKTEIDGVKVPVPIGIKAGYNNPVEFHASISMSGGEADAKEYGFELGSYQAILVTSDKTLPIAETSRIWYKNPIIKGIDGSVDGDSADYSVLAVKESLNSVKYILKQLPKRGAELG